MKIALLISILAFTGCTTPQRTPEQQALHDKQVVRLERGALRLAGTLLDGYMNERSRGFEK